MLPVADLFPFLTPIVVLILGALACLVAEPLLRDSSKHTVLPWMALSTIVLAGIALRFTNPGHLHGLFATDFTRSALAAVLLVVAALGVAGLQQNLSEDRFAGGEAYALMLLATIGAIGMVFSVNTISLFVSMELASLAIYPLVGLRRDSVVSSEGLLKYFVMGAVFSALFLYGASLMYGATGTTSMVGPVFPGRENVHLLGFALVAVGLLFKTGTAPFHTWSPDAYTAAPSSVTGFMAGAVKVGAFAALGAVWINFLASQSGRVPMAPLDLSIYIPPEVLTWVQPEVAARFQIVGKALAILALLSIVLGSLSLLGQRSLRRLTAFSGVTNAGFLVLALLLPSFFQGHVQLGALWYYLAVYALSAAGAMVALSALTGPGDEGDHLSSLTGAARRRPLAGLALTVFLASLAGLPPAAGFIAKFQILSGLTLWSLNLAQMTINARLIWIPAIAMIFALVAAAGYLRVLVVLWSAGSASGEGGSSPKLLLSWVVTLVALGVLALSVGPQILFHP
ncbi:MAG: NADH-quinone oxidoreductase subunit N [Fibrobacteria bacterium]|nr:NADH-quinone oxidoreductase subunit N [Fibrobacteria bacterium]